MLDHHAAQFPRSLAEHVEGEIDVIGQSGIAGGRRLPFLAVDLLSQQPFRVGAEFLAHFEEMNRIERIGILDLQPLSRLADWLEERLAMLLDQGFEESQPQDLSLAFINARGEEIVDVVAEDVPLEKRPATMRFHEEFDGRFLLRLAAEDLGNDAFQFTAITFVDNPSAPGYEANGAGNQ